MPGQQQYRDLNKEIFNGGEYYRVSRPLNGEIGVEASNMLTYLLNVGQNNATPGGWILATPGFIEEGLGMDRKQQDSILSLLENQDLVEIDLRGKRRYIRINVEEVRDRLDLD